jgi:FkbM family methyltransferase
MFFSLARLVLNRLRMKSSEIQRVVYHLPWYSRFSQHHLRRYLKKVQRKNRLKNYPQLACVPSDAIGQWIVLNGLYEEELLISFETVFKHYLAKFKQQTFIDVGANIGNHSLFFSRYFKEVIAFEPNPTALKLLETNIFLNQTKNIHMAPIGLSNESGTLPFIENSENLGGSKFNLKCPHTATYKKLNVEKGDTILYRDFKASSIGIIKLDIEGFELQALQGLKQTLIQYQPVVLFEAHTSQGETGSQAIFDYLSPLHYAYFYTLERKKLNSGLINLLVRLLSGYEIVLRPLTRPKNQFYSLIIATTTPLE